jgi:hypothetical protein
VTAAAQARSRVTRALTIICVVAGSLYLAKAVYRGTSFTQGDFYYSLPGLYAERLNPTLWNSPDLRDAEDFNHGQYPYGPTQFLTLFPIVFLNSYQAIAATLLVVYVGVLLLAYYLLWKLLASGEADSPGTAAMVFAIVFAFLPLTQALIQREFEVVALLALVAGCLLFVRGRETASGAAVAYLTWFKYWPIVLLGAFVMHRRVKGLAAFVIASIVLLLTTHAIFGLQHFRIAQTADIVTSLMRPLGGGEVLYPAIERGAQKSDFCRQWIWGRGTAADVRWELCGLEDRFPRLPAKGAFFAIVAATGGVFLWGAFVLGGRRPQPLDAKWGAIWEFSVLAIAGSAFVHAHYYYLIVFVLPLSALAFWYATRPQPWRRTKIALWVASYLLLNAFMMPTSWLSAVLQRNVWTMYLDSGLCLLGMMVLLGLVLWEFARLAAGESPALAMV